MRAHWPILGVSVVVALLAGAFHFRVANTMAQLESTRVALETEIGALRASQANDNVNARTKREAAGASLAKNSSRPGVESKPSANTEREPAASLSEAELRRLQVQAHVSEQRLRFAGVLRRLGVNVQQLQEFDRIEATYYSLISDPSQSRQAKEEARRTRDTQLETLLGSAYPEWREASRDLPARAIVTRIVQQTLQSTAPLNAAQAEELTRIVTRHALPNAASDGGYRPRYNWDSIIIEARTLLADEQMAGFITAVHHRRVSDQMSAISARKK